MSCNISRLLVTNALYIGWVGLFWSPSLHQDIITVAYLGPLWSYSYQSALTKFGPNVKYDAQSSISMVFDAVHKRKAVYGIVPFENSTYGSVQETLDAFLALPVESPLVVCSEIAFAIHHSLLSTSALSEIKKVYSHPQALGQCAKWLHTNLPHVEQVGVSSTSAAAEMAKNEPGAAAICSAACAELYNLNIIDRNIEDLLNNTTRFFVLGNSIDPPNHSNRTLLYFTVDPLKRWAVSDVMDTLKRHHIEIRRINSMPSGEHLWHYIYFIEMDGHVHDVNMKDAFLDLSSLCQSIRVVGSFHAQR
ncbi:hypothetical protein BASA61_000209 [Batrachochytrium salamandrivorans]|nr:hypothetical protein BASA60_011306 [Batrachochytrium salamandrivorans]KAH6575836.1 hypothetical protein BASA60_004775 [Batrachochytrium salamandrivorans]KAH6578451.1 hypothetical protein BASA61_000209 [Batrachochytrium salamandrivorans]KAH9268234.1 hypothetical protein BASA84_000298 [Batrachochytrium salamandrivorans]